MKKKISFKVSEIKNNDYQSVIYGKYHKPCDGYARRIPCIETNDWYTDTDITPFTIGTLNVGFK
jgi:hypothetical protein